MSNIYDFVGEVVDEPIKSNNAAGDIRLLWDKPQRQRLRNQTLRSASGNKTMTYTLLYYIPGLTTYCGLHGIPIITGYMTGCYLFRYRQNGELRVAHVGTDDLKQDWSDKAKAAWKSIVANPNVTDIYGFDPINDVSDKLYLIDSQKAGMNPQVIGIWEGNGSARMAVIVSSKSHRGKKILVGIEAAPLRPWASIQNEKKMR